MSSSGESLLHLLQAQLPATQKMAVEASRTKLLPLVGTYYREQKDIIRQRFEADSDPVRVVKDTAALVDDIITQLLEFAAGHGLLAEKTMEDVAVIAVGGYGRGELFPFSDIDLLFLYQKGHEKSAAAVADLLLYILWDLKLTVGQSVQSVEQAITLAREDITIRTTLLDMRCIWGSRKLFEKMTQHFQQEIADASKIAFVEGKLAERDQRHHRCGDSRYVLEPNIKDGKGGLRDLHTLYWLAKYIYGIKSVSELVKLQVLTAEEYKAYRTAERFLWTVRVHLHYLAGRAEERLTFDRQREIGTALGYREQGKVRAVERFMKRYFQTARSVGTLTRIFCSVLEVEKNRKPRLLQTQRDSQSQAAHFMMDGERLNFATDVDLEANPSLTVELFHIAQQEQVDIHPHALQLVARSLSLLGREQQKDPRINNLLMEILLAEHQPEVTLRRMNDTGILGRLIPDFGRVIGQMQYDMYHVFTVDEHTIFAIGILHGVEKGRYKEDMPLATKIVHQIISRRVLYLAVFCHDIAKGRGGDHSILGEKVAYKLATRFGFTPQERETTAWLVRYHLLMSNTAFKRDINDQKTIRDFVDKVQSLERLRLLLVLTVADIRAVGPQVWNGWKGALLRELYYNAEALITAGDTAKAQTVMHETLQQELVAQLPAWSADEVEDYLQLGNASFWSMTDAAGHARIARMVKEVSVLALPLKLQTNVDLFRSNTEIILCTPDQHGLFSKVCGVMALCGANIVNCKIFTLKNGLAVELFNVQDEEGKAYDRPDRLAKMAALLEMALSGQLDMEKEFSKKRLSYPSRLDAFKVPPAVFIDNNVSAQHTVIELSGRDRIGFLYSVTKVLSDQGLTIATAHISTYGERAVDVFYVKDVFGMKITHERKLKQIQDALMQALAPPADMRKEAS